MQNRTGKCRTHAGANNKYFLLKNSMLECGRV